MSVAKIAEVTFTSADRVWDVIHNFNTDGFDSLYPKYSGGRPRTFTLPERREINEFAKSKPTAYDLPFSTWSLTKLADFLVAEGVVDDISHEGLRILLREEGVSLSTAEDLEDLPRPRLRGQEGPRRTPLRDRRRRGHTRGGRARSRLMYGRVRAAQPDAPPWSAVGRTLRQRQGPRP
nr:helix-turn-helix domain-containing protein [Actinomadura atramentaria]